ncbi:MAG TPA: ATP-binding protein [Kofleriaceae bacterium]|jgi:signal transduction histidine kinase|nr:ATP-binding protein [Kofleriaceae bacterium]
MTTTATDLMYTADPAITTTRHSLQLYESEEHLDDAVARFLGSALGAGEPVVMIAGPRRRAALIRHLEAHGFDVERARRSSRLSMFDASDLLARFMIDDSPDPELFRAQLRRVVAHASGPSSRRVRVYSETVNLLWRDGNRRGAQRLERLWNELTEELPLSVLCAYPLRDFDLAADAVDFEEVCGAHDHLRPTERFTTISHPDDRLIEVCRLQQRAWALEREIDRRRELEEAATEASRAKDEFLAMLGHELRNPLAPIVTALQIARLRGLESRELGVIERQVDHLIRLVDDLLDISRITRGKVELRKERIEIAEVVGQGVEIASPLLESRRQTLVLDVERDGCAVDGDRARLAQVVANLLTNAAKYSEPESRIDVWAGYTRGCVRVRVRDAGIGIEPEMLSRIFDSFVQRPQAKDRSQGGLGLGLAIVRSLVELHGGAVGARSDGPGRGAEFEVELPAAAADDGVVMAAVEGEPTSRLSARPTSARVLVVDDNEDAAVTLAEALAGLGHDVRIAHDGPSALEVAAEFLPQVGLLDIGLPVMDGYELAERLRAAPWAGDLRLIAVTGYGQERDQARAREAGFMQQLVKPVSLAVVDGLVRGSTATA